MMRTLFTLLTLCIFSANANAEWRNELFALGGAGKNFRNEARQFSGNFGMSASNGGEVLYFNAGLSLYYLRGEGASSWYFSNSSSQNFITEFAVGGGVMGQIDNATLRLGPDVGGNFSLNNGDFYLSFAPKFILSFGLGNMDLGLMTKASFPMWAPGNYYPTFYGGGIILGF